MTTENLDPVGRKEEMGTKSIWTIAHRGASGHAPENTIAAFRRAVDLGASFIETDLQLTRDARVIAIHDFTLDRTTTGKGQVHLLPLDQIRDLDAGAWFGDGQPKLFSDLQHTLEPRVHTHFTGNLYAEALFFSFRQSR